MDVELRVKNVDEVDEAQHSTTQNERRERECLCVFTRRGCMCTQ